MSNSVVDLGKEIEEIKPSTGMAMVISAQTRYAAYCTLLSQAVDSTAMEDARRDSRNTFIDIADEIYNRVPKAYRQ